jgi:hypothetical protein
MVHVMVQTGTCRYTAVSTVLHIHEVLGSNPNQALDTSQQIHVENSIALLACNPSLSRRAIPSLPLETMQLRSCPTVVK